jgi:hypothetical protein
MKKIFFLFIILILIIILFHFYSIFSNYNKKNELFRYKFLICDYNQLDLYYYKLYSKLFKNDFEIINIENIIKNNYNNFILITIDVCNTLSWDNTIYDYIKNNNITLIIVNQELYPSFSLLEILDKLKDIHLILLTFCNHNYSNLKNNPNINKLIYLPLLYHNSQEEIYNNFVTNKIEWENKDIDILISGNMFDKRVEFVEKFKKKFGDKYKLAVKYTIHENEYYNLLERTKIVMCIRKKFVHDNKDVTYFDYCRNSILLSNKIFFISEPIENEDIDYNIEQNFIDYDKYLILSKYENMIDTFEKYINYDKYTINYILNKQYQWWCKYNFQDNFLNLI